MKTKHIIVALLCLFMATNAEAQILKKLKKKAEEAVERTILKKTDEAVTEKTEQAIDSVTKPKSKKDKKIKDKTADNKKANKAKNSLPKENSKKIGETEKNSGKQTSEEEKKAKEQKIMDMFGGGLEGVPETYEFTYLMEMTLKTNKESMQTQYYLMPNADYFGNSMQENPNSIVVYDMENKAMVTFMDNGQQKMAMKINMKMNAKLQNKLDKKLETSKGKSEKLEIIPIESKTILGYKCDGYQVISKEGVSKFWITNAAPVSMTDVFSNGNSMPNSLQGLSLPFTNKTSILEMNFESSKSKKDDVSMICTKLIKNKLIINKKEYQSGN